jgi:L-ascorbate metabolism protein UlaG (beta-lactamase superfamily)
VGGGAAAEVVRALGPRLVVPMHYRTPAIGFLDPPDAFLDALGAPVERLDEPEFDPAHHLASIGRPAVVMPAAPPG